MIATEEPLSQQEWGAWRDFFNKVHDLAQDTRHQSQRASDSSYSFMAQRDFALWQILYHPPVWTNHDRAYLRWDNPPAEYDDPSAPLQIVWDYNNARLARLSLAVSNPASERPARFSWNGQVEHGEEIILEISDHGPWNKFLREELIRLNERLERGVAWHRAVSSQEKLELERAQTENKQKELSRARANWQLEVARTVFLSSQEPR
jgi:hypothetical protein